MLGASNLNIGERSAFKVSIWIWDIESSSDCTVPVPGAVMTNIEESEFQIVLLLAVGPIFKFTGRAKLPKTEPHRVTLEFPVAGPLE
jgi:hypothetical protein